MAQRLLNRLEVFFSRFEELRNYEKFPDFMKLTHYPTVEHLWGGLQLDNIVMNDIKVRRASRSEKNCQNIEGFGAEGKPQTVFNIALALRSQKLPRFRFCIVYPSMIEEFTTMVYISSPLPAIETSSFRFLLYIPVLLYNI